MLIWICALHCEAKPIIDFYHLKKTTPKANFDMYSNHDMVCIVSGIGSAKMSKATDWAEALFGKDTRHCWINLGIAGHKDLALGTTVLISQASADNSANNPAEIIKTQTTIEHSFITKPVISLTQEQTDYDAEALFDMEAFAFLYTTSKLSALDMRQAIKVISDNRQTPPNRNKARISKLIADNMQSISEFALQLTTRHNK